MPSSSLSSDAEIVARSFVADAWILGSRWKHHRIRDHFGADSDLYVVLDADVGPYPAFTPVHWVIADMVERISRLEDYNQHRSSFVTDAWLATSGTYGRGIFTIDAIVKDAGTGSLTADAFLMRGGSFTLDAIFMPSFTADAFISLL